MRRTRQREVIKRVVCSAKCHPPADYVYEEARKELPCVSLGTVYRNLKLLVARGELQVIEDVRGANRYDACVDQHYHFVCDRCGGVFDVSLDVGCDLERVVSERTGFDVRSHTLEFYGVCERCRGDSVIDAARST